MEAKISSHKKLDSQDYLIEVILGNALAYGQVNGRKYVALGRNVSRLRKLFDSSGGSGIVLVRKYVYKVRD